MAHTSTFYPGSVNSKEWGEGQGHVGGEYFVASYDAGRVSVVSAATRTVRVNVGRIGGHGVMDTITAAQDIQITDSLPVGSASKWYLIVARRTWQTTNATTFVAITGTATKQIPSGRNVAPGTIDDQPLALVQITGSSTVPTAIVDLRAIGWGKGAYEAYDDLVLQYMTKVGYRIRIGAVVWERVAPGGVEAWVVQLAETSGVLSLVAGYSPTEGQPRWVRLGSRVFLSGGVVRSSSGGAFTASVPFGVVSVPVEIRPSISKRVGVSATWSGLATARFDAGQLKLEFGSSGSMPTGTWFASLEGISWEVS